MSNPIDASHDLDIRERVVAQVRRRQQIWFVVTGVAVAFLVAALLMLAVGAGNSSMPSLHYDPAKGFSFGAERSTDVKKFDDGEVLLPGGGSVDCGVGITPEGKADGGLSCDWSSFDPDESINTLRPTDFMKRYSIVSGKDAGQWCITAKLLKSTAGAPAYQVECGTQTDAY